MVTLLEMPKRFLNDVYWRWASLALGVAVALPFATACDSNDGQDGVGTSEPHVVASGSALTVDEYFQELDLAFTRLRDAVAASAPPIAPGQIPSTADILPLIQDAMTGLEQAMTPFIREVEALNPPSSLAEAHNDFLNALDKDSEAIADLAELVRQADSLAEATSAFESRRNALVESREPCLKLQEIADREGIDVSLPCEE